MMALEWADRALFLLLVLALLLVLIVLLLGPLLADGRGSRGLRGAHTRQLKRLGGGLNRRQLP